MQLTRRIVFEEGGRDNNLQLIIANVLQKWWLTFDLKKKCVKKSVIMGILTFIAHVISLYERTSYDYSFLYGCFTVVQYSNNETAVTISHESSKQFRFTRYEKKKKKKRKRRKSRWHVVSDLSWFLLRCAIKNCIKMCLRMQWCKKYVETDLI